MGHAAVVSDTLYFGTKKQNPDQSWTTVVTPEIWGQFASTELARAFPDGSTSWVAQGTWKAPDGTTVAETSYVTTLVHSDGPEAHQALTQLIELYKARYEQKSVFWVVSHVCAKF